jgi:hypothetical protein
MAAIFPPGANLVAKLVLVGLAGSMIAGTAWWWLWPRTDYLRHTHWTVEQPVPFSHQHHVAGLGIDCRFCHTTVETAADAGLPPTYTCMTCHSQLWTNAALLAPVRRSLTENQPLVWHASAICLTTPTSTMQSTLPKASAARAAMVMSRPCRLCKKRAALPWGSVSIATRTLAPTSGRVIRSSTPNGIALRTHHRPPHLWQITTSVDAT